MHDLAPLGTLPGIAVVVPFYRADRWVTEAVESVRRQTYPPREVVVVDDSRPGDEREALRALGSGVTVLAHPRNLGVGAARQTGTDATSAELLAYLDADDWLEPSYLAAAVETLQRHPKAAGCYANVVKRHPDGSAVRYDRKPALLDVREAVVRSHAYATGLVVRRDALAAIGGWCTDRDVVEDWDLVVRLLDRFDGMPLVPEPAINYRVGNTGGLNSQHWHVLRRWRKTVRINRELLERHYGAGAARRRLAQAFADRHDRAGGWRGAAYGAIATALGRPLREAFPG